MVGGRGLSEDAIPCDTIQHHAWCFCCDRSRCGWLCCRSWSNISGGLLSFMYDYCMNGLIDMGWLFLNIGFRLCHVHCSAHILCMNRFQRNSACFFILFWNSGTYYEKRSSNLRQIIEIRNGPCINSIGYFPVHRYLMSLWILLLNISKLVSEEKWLNMVIPFIYPI